MVHNFKLSNQASYYKKNIGISHWHIKLSLCHWENNILSKAHYNPNQYQRANKRTADAALTQVSKTASLEHISKTAANRKLALTLCAGVGQNSLDQQAETVCIHQLKGSLRSKNLKIQTFIAFSDQRSPLLWQFLNLNLTAYNRICLKNSCCYCQHFGFGRSWKEK